MWFTKYSKEAHKHASRALYKALLTHAAHLPPSPSIDRAALAIHIRRRFRKSRSLEGKPRHTALREGYDSETLLRQACQNHEPSLTTVIHLLDDLRIKQAAKAASSLPPWPVYKPPTPPSQLNPTRKSKIREMNMTKREKGLRSWRARIKPPAMGAISGIPLLKRPGRRIPDAVSTLIRNKIKRKLREVNEINNIKENTKYYAEMEDRWDATLSEIQGERLDKEELTWEEWATLSRSILRDNFFDSEKRDYEITKRFQGIIDSETAWYKEHLRKTRKHKRDRAWQRLSQDAEKKTKKLKEVWENVKDSHNAEQ